MARHGENIRKRKDGRWEARYEKKRGMNGAICYGYLYGHSYTEVKKKREQVLLDLRRGIVVAGPNMTLNNLFEEWMREIRITVKESTFALYATIIRVHLSPELGGFKLRHLSTQTISSFSRTALESLAPGTVRNILVLLKRVLRYGEKRGYMSLGNIDVVYPKVPDHPFRVMPEPQVQTLADRLMELESPLALGLLLCIFCGIRVGELCGMKWGDVDLETGVIHILRTVSRIINPSAGKDGGRKTLVVVTSPKTRSSLRDVPVPDFLSDKLTSLRKGAGSYFLTGTPLHLEPRSVQRGFHRMLQSCNLPPVNIHSLRHSFASRCAQLGMDPRTLSDILGHSSVKITMDLYVHSSAEQKRDSINRLYGEYLPSGHEIH